MTRIKTVYPSRDIPRLWMRSTSDTDYARNQRGTLYFEGDVIYSYGRHFPIARKVRNERGEHAILFTTRNYSVTTAKHKSMMRHVCNNDHFLVDDVFMSADDAPMELHRKEDEIRDAVKKWMRSRRYKDYCLGFVRRLCQHTAEFARFYSLAWEVPREGIFAQIAER